MLFLMDWVITIGAFSFGSVIGWLVRETFVRQPGLDTKTLAAIVEVMAGGAVVGALQKIVGTKSGLPRELWFYPVGILTGILVTWLIQELRKRQEREIQQKPLEAELERKKLESAKESLLQLIKNRTKKKDGKPITMVTFETIERLQGSEFTKEFVSLVVKTYPETFLFKTLEKGEGIGLHPRMVSPDSPTVK